MKASILPSLVSLCPEAVILADETKPGSMELRADRCLPLMCLPKRVAILGVVKIDDMLQYRYCYELCHFSKNYHQFF